MSSVVRFASTSCPFVDTPPVVLLSQPIYVPGDGARTPQIAEPMENSICAHWSPRVFGVAARPLSRDL